ncbi:hypothetical protein MHEL_57650 [Mycolicibacterium helvum]|uniref:Phosphoribosyl-ATP pyrophosphatase n=2 Tax=Mycobacteriaceae TaxID=1762 RepID=A0A7I7TE60_9MYCO|nr:hypothetical protein MHEL_57650 [Mycolicibacterium helvum]
MVTIGFEQAVSARAATAATVVARDPRTRRQLSPDGAPSPRTLRARIGTERAPTGNRRDGESAHMEQSQAVKTFEELFAELGERARTRPAGSATVAALDAGVHTLGKKILEEAGEVWLAAEHEPDEALAEEISQLLYWTQVLMVARGLTLDDIYRKL